MRLASRPDVSLPLYEHAAAQARTVAESESDASKRAMSDLGAITGNWALALRDVGRLASARQRQIETVDAKKKAGSPAIEIVGSELEAFRLEIMQGKVEGALPEVKTRLAQLEVWWQQDP